MKARTRWGIETAERDRRLAEYLAATSSEILPDHRWATIAAFYAAVQYVNALLFERLDFIPRSHMERESAIAMIAELNAVQDAYYRLKEAAVTARYTPRSTLTYETVRRYLDILLPAIRDAVLANLEPEG